MKPSESRSPALTPVGKYIDLYREHCGSEPTLNNQEAEVINRLTEWARSETAKPDPLTLELADELFGCFLSRAAPDADHSWECAVCEEPVTMPNWITSKHAEGCAVAKARDYLAKHAPHRTPGYEVPTGVERHPEEKSK